jgi:hypothetical protein
MLRLTSVACAVAIAFAGPLSAFEIPLFEQYSTKTVVAESPESLTISEETLEYESILHLADYITAAEDLIVAYNSGGLALIRLAADQMTILREYKSQDLNLNGLSYINLSEDGSLLFVYKYDAVVVYEIGADGTLTELASENTYTNTQYKMDATSSFIKFEYAFPGSSVSVHSFDKASATFNASQPLYIQEQPQFAIYDETKEILVLGYYDYNLSTHVVQSYRLDAQAQLNLVSELQLDGLPEQRNVAYAKDSGTIFLIGYSSTQLQLATNGVLQHITSNNDVLPTNYSNKSIVAGSTLYVSSGEMVQSFNINGTEVTEGTTLSEQSTRDLTSLNGRLTSLEENSLSYYPQGIDSGIPVLLKRGEQSMSLLPVSNAENMAFSDNYFFRANGDGAELYKVEENGAVTSLNFIDKKDFYPGANNWFTTVVHKLGESSVVAMRGMQLRVFTFNQENETLTQTMEVDLNDMLSEINQTSSVQSTAVFGSYLLVRTYDKLHLFTFADNTITYLDTAAAGVNEFTELPELNNGVDKNGTLVVYNFWTNTIQELSVVNAKLKQRDLFASPQNQSGISQLRFVSDQLHVHFNSTVYVYKEIDEQFRLLSLNNLPVQSAIYLNERLVLIPVDGSKAQIAKLDLESGLFEEQQTIEFNNYLNLRHAFMMGQHLYLESTSTPLEVRRYLLNRAPDLAAIPAEMEFSEGLSFSTDLTSFIKEPDANQTLTFSLVNAVTGVTVSEQGSLTYDGSPLTASNIMVRATDSTDLYSDFSLSFTSNKAPALAQPWSAPVLNQNKAFVLDLNEFFADPEGSVLTYEITSTANFSITTKGIVSGTLVADEAQQLEVIVKDSKGATSSHTLDLNVNAAPVLTGSASQTVSTDETVSIDLTSLFSDAEDQSISFSAQSLPAGLTLSGSTISGKVANAGKFSTLITATDSAGATSQATLNFEVTQPKGSSGSFGWYAVMALLAISLGRRFKKV